MVELIVVFILTVLSILERIRLKARAQADFSDILKRSKASLLSEAIASLVATAGGIYLSLILLGTFLGLEIPSTIEIYSVKFEPIAGIAILLALIQPFIQKIYEWLFK